jgi:hypothetical protein
MRIIFAIIMLVGSVLAASAEVQSARVNIYGGFPQNVVGNKNFVIVSNVWNEMDAFPVAERFCQQYRRSARVAYVRGYRAGYDCIP